MSNGVITIRAKNVTIRNSEFINTRIVNEYGQSCGNVLKVEDTTIRSQGAVDWNYVLGAGGMSLNRVKIDGVPEGLRIEGKDVSCQPVTVTDSYINVTAPANCTNNQDWHGDGIQGYQGVKLIVRNTRINLGEKTPQGTSCTGTAAFFYPDQGNTEADVDGLLVSGGPYPFQLGTPGTVKNLKVVDGSWWAGPTYVTSCPRVTWGTGNEVVSINPDGSLKTVRALACG